MEQLNALVALIEADPSSARASLAATRTSRWWISPPLGLEIGRRWGESDPPAASDQPNLLASTPPPVGSEQIEVLLEGELKLERIHSCAASTPAGQWYDQDQGEWVSPCRAAPNCALKMSPSRGSCAGDWLWIATPAPPVEATDGGRGCLWLACFCHNLC